MKSLLLIATLSASSFCFANSGLQRDLCFVGDSVAHGYKQAYSARYGALNGTTEVGASASKVLQMLKGTDNIKCHTVVLSSGISNSPTAYSVVDRQIQWLQTQNVNVLLLGTSNRFPKYGNELNIKLNSICGKYSNCRFLGGFSPSKDKVHPKSYKVGGF